MTRTALVALALVGTLTSAYAEDISTAPAQPSIVPPATAAARTAPQIDLSRPVTLTGAELQAYVQAAIAAEQARAAAQAAAPVVEKVRNALTVPTADAPKP